MATAELKGVSEVRVPDWEQINQMFLSFIVSVVKNIV